MGDTPSGEPVTERPKVADRELQRFLDECLERIRAAFHPQAFWLFGSRVDGTPDEWSDIDVLVVSERFRGLSVFDRTELFQQHARPHRHVDALCYTPEEFEIKAAQPTLVAEIVKQGLRVI